MRHFAFYLVALASFTVACGAVTGLREDDAGLVVDPGVDVPPTQLLQPFERCTVRDTCGGGTTCLPALFNADTVAARLCTLPCASGSGCPMRGTHSSFGVACATQGTEVVRGQCFEVCENDSNCGAGTQCVAHNGIAIRVCLPVGIAP